MWKLYRNGLGLFASFVSQLGLGIGQKPKWLAIILWLLNNTGGKKFDKFKQNISHFEPRALDKVGQDPKCGLLLGVLLVKTLLVLGGKLPE